MQLLTIITWIFILLAAYVYTGYPILLALLAKIYKHPVQKADITPSVSLIIAAYNEAEVIGEKAENSLQLDYPRQLLEIIFVTDGSSDRTPEVVRGYTNQGITLLHEDARRGKSAAINRGVAQSKGEILVFSDANAFYQADAIKKLMRNFNDPTVGCVSGRKTVVHGDSAIGESEGAYWKYESFIKKTESLIHSTAGVVGEMTALRRSLFEPIPPAIINDDHYLSLRVIKKGYRVIYEPEAISQETSAVSTRDETIRRQRINAGRYQLMFQPGEVYPWNNPIALFQMISHKFMRLLLPFFMIGALVCNTLVILSGSDNILMWLTFMGQIAFYGLALVGMIAEQRGKRLKLPGIAYYIVSSNGASLRGFMRYIRGKQSVLWEKAARSKAAQRS
ncbi:MAG TPA: glycosyltransferase family 2 protein [Aggregatilineales bacterium]|nr:glycosyltransferase family 2 protein [Aggregatilineales bacterium]